MKIANLFRRSLTFATDRISNLPVLVLMPHSRCNCRCVMCDIWKANANKKEITAEELEKHARHFKALGVREIVFSGGEALMHSNLWALCGVLQQHDIKLTLLSTGLLLDRNAEQVINNFKEVIVSIDGSPVVHDRIRNIPNGFQKLADGVAAIKKRAPGFRITARCVLQRYNFQDFSNIVQAAKNIGIDQISFLPADVSTSAFNHQSEFVNERVHEIALSRDESIIFAKLIEDSFVTLALFYKSGFIAESPSKMTKIAEYYKAVNGLNPFPGTTCNAPWVSAVVESDGRVMPCFFHEAYGNIYQEDFLSLINSKKAIDFRKKLNTTTDSICQKCVCSLRLGRTEML